MRVFILILECESWNIWRVFSEDQIWRLEGESTCGNFYPGGKFYPEFSKIEECLKIHAPDGKMVNEVRNEIGRPIDEYFQPLGKFQKRIKSLARPDNPI